MNDQFVFGLNLFLIFSIFFTFILILAYVIGYAIYSYKDEVGRGVAKLHVSIIKRYLNQPKTRKRLSIDLNFDTKWKKLINNNGDYFKSYGNEKYASSVFSNPWLVAANIYYTPNVIYTNSIKYTASNLYLYLSEIEKKNIDTLKLINRNRRLKPYVRMVSFMHRHKDSLGGTPDYWFERQKHFLGVRLPHLKRKLNIITILTKFNIIFDFAYWLFVEKFIILQHKLKKIESWQKKQTLKQAR